MKTAEELNTIKNDVEALNKKLAKLSEEELEQVAGGSRRTDDPDQKNAHHCITDVLSILMGDKFIPTEIKGQLLGEVNYVWDRTLSWHGADPIELMPKVMYIIGVLSFYISVPDLNTAWEKAKACLNHLENLAKKD